MTNTEIRLKTLQQQEHYNALDSDDKKFYKNIIELKSLVCSYLGEAPNNPKDEVSKWQKKQNR